MERLATIEDLKAPSSLLSLPILRRCRRGASVRAQAAASVSMPLLVVLVLWLTVIFMSFGLFAPFNVTVVASLLIAALSVAGAIFLILEMYGPYDGVIQVSSAPLRAALAYLGQ